ncbi:MAG: aminodeoxychorismate/anthranilate synthase component II [Flavobacteriales bacterium]|nr:aminodeoxychorismate/anthranilate synthase component II [Flavobacteriales bacterium]
MRILLLDNYDSFTWNLHHMLYRWGEVTVKRNDAITVEEAAAYDRIVLSPGPGLPSEAGIMPELVHRLMPSHTILGVCLGLQAIVEECGGSLINLPNVRHGVAVPCIPAVPVAPLFADISAPLEVGLYHSWAADPSTLPAELQVTAHSSEGVIMALQHTQYNTCAVQFHPESVLTPAGEQLIRNWAIEYSPGPYR